jgi:hypothetical protein
VAWPAALEVYFPLRSQLPTFTPPGHIKVDTPLAGGLADSSVKCFARNGLTIRHAVALLALWHREFPHFSSPKIA